MRQVLSLSLSPQMAKEIKAIAKQRGFASVSGYIKYLLEADKNLISTEKLIADSKLAKQEYRSGQAITANSLAEALKFYDSK